MDFEHLEMEAVASLKEHDGYKILLDALQAQIDDTQAVLDTCESSVEPKILALWRALRRTLAILKTGPERMEEELKLERARIQEEAATYETVPMEQLYALQQHYKQLKEKEKKK